MSFAVITRIYSPDVVSINVFVEYYLQYLKFDKMYFIITDGSSEGVFLNAIDDKLHNKITFYSHDPRHPTNLNSCVNLYFKKVEEDFVLSIDSDEYLYLNGDTVKGLHSEFDADCYMFYWVRVSSTENQNRKIQDVLNKEFTFTRSGRKFLFKKDSVVRLQNHQISLGKGRKGRVVKDFKDSYYYINIHVTRGIFDYFIKTFNNYVNIKWNKWGSGSVRDRIILRDTALTYVGKHMKYFIDVSKESLTKTVSSSKFAGMPSGLRISLHRFNWEHIESKKLSPKQLARGVKLEKKKDYVFDCPDIKAEIDVRLEKEMVKKTLKEMKVPFEDFSREVKLKIDFLIKETKW